MFSFRMLATFFGLSLSFLVSIHVSAEVKAVVITSQEKLSAPSWLVGDGEIPKNQGVYTQLMSAKSAQLSQDFKQCFEQAERASAGAGQPAKTIRAWLANVALDCGARIEASPVIVNRLARVIERVEKNPQWLLSGAQAVSLRQSLVRAYLFAIEQDIKTNRARAWQWIEKSQELSSGMDEKSRARLWSLAGDLAFIQQKPEAARELLSRSLSLAESGEVRSRLQAVESTLASFTNKSLEISQPKETKPPNHALEASQEENALVDRVTQALKAGDLLSAVDDAKEIISDYPGGTRAQWASARILEVYTNLIDKPDSKVSVLREQLIKRMLSVHKYDPDRLHDWARVLSQRGQYADALTLVKKALDDQVGHRTTKHYELISEIALATDQFDEARNALNILIEKHAGTAQARVALYRSGLLSYRMRQYSQAILDFEKLMALPQTENYEIVARYWMWRSLQKMKSDRAQSVADELVSKFPFSYYGLRARLESSRNVLEWKPTQIKVESKMWLTGPERVAFEKARILIKAGWLDEAQAELRELPTPVRAEDKAVRAILWAAAAHYVNASKLANEAWDEKSELRGSPLVEASFPKDYAAFVKDQAEVKKLDRYLVRGLIKQESSFNSRSVSPSNALGLMQMLPSTAKEIASDLKLGQLKIPEDLFDPKRNIQLGTQYFSRLVTKYKGHVPLALAAYNAGPGRVDRWIKARPSLKSLLEHRSSAPEDELWFDEIPYWETSVYVKSILRNMLLYRVLDQGRVEVSNPIWANGSGS